MGIYRERGKRKAKVEGTELVKRLVKLRGLGEVARRTQSAETTVRHWVFDRRRPSTDARLALAAEFDIPLESWKKDEPEKQEKPKPPVRTEQQSLDHIDDGIPTKHLIQDQLRGLRAKLTRAEQDGAGWRDIMSIEGKITSALRLRSMLTGEQEVTEATILRSSAWAKLMSRLQRVLEKHPDVTKEMLEALEDFSA